MSTAVAESSTTAMEVELSNEAEVDHDDNNIDKGDNSSEKAEAAAPPLDSTSPRTDANENNDSTEAVVVKSRIPEIWNSFFQQMDAIDDMEKRLNEYATRSRRRTAALLEQTPSHRRSHLRMFVTHMYDTEAHKWTVVIEGKLLIGHLDHQRAARIEQEKEATKQGTDGVTSAPASSSKAPSASPTAASTTTTMAEPETSRSDRSKYRSIGEIEEDPIEPTFFTHYFQKLVVTFRTIYQPIKAPSSSASSSPKFTTSKKTNRGRSKAEKKKKSGEDDGVVNPKHLKSSDAQTLSWNRDDKNSPGDAHAFFVTYMNDESRKPPPSGMKFHSVVAAISMYPSRTAAEQLYQPSNALADNFFPKHKNDTGRSTRGGTEPSSKKRKTDDGGAVDTTETAENLTNAPIPLMNEIIAVPSLMTMDEIIMGLYQYIHDRKLQDANDKSRILCDKVLSNLLDCESISFADLKQTLLTKNLIVPVSKDDKPVVLNYVMTEKTTSPQSPTAKAGQQEDAPSTAPVPGDDDEERHPQVLSFDMDIWVPSLFHYRARDLMRRVKRREFEYTSSRTKARYLLVASRGNEDIVKNKLEQAVSGRGYVAENVPIFLALAKAAPPDSEARGSAQADAKICALVGRVDECSRKAEASRELVEAFVGASGMGS